jgi:hypothetical protein
MDEQNLRNRRRFERFAVQPMYSTVIATPAQWARSVGLHGHVYDISAAGVRVELDQQLPLGQPVAMKIGLPGARAEIGVSGEVVWVHSDEDDPGPKRMAMQFTDFASQADEDCLQTYLSQASRRAA